MCVKHCPVFFSLIFPSFFRYNVSKKAWFFLVASLGDFDEPKKKKTKETFFVRTMKPEKLNSFQLVFVQIKVVSAMFNFSKKIPTSIFH